MLECVYKIHSTTDDKRCPISIRAPISNDDFNCPNCGFGNDIIVEFTCELITEICMFFYYVRSFRLCIKYINLTMLILYVCLLCCCVAVVVVLYVMAYMVVIMVMVIYIEYIVWWLMNNM